MKLYKIRDWDRLFENNRSREIKSLTFVLFPNRHDGENFSAIMAHKNGAEIFSAWCLILQVASKCDPRGTLLRGGKKPHDSASLALKTRAPEKWFKLALEFLESETDWFVVENVTDQPELIPHPHAAIPHSPAVPMFCSVLLDSVPSGGCKGEIVTVGNGAKQGETISKSKSVDEVKAYCVEIGLPESDGEWFWDKCVGCGWTNAGKTIKDWRATIRAWKGRGYMASQSKALQNGHSVPKNGSSGIDKTIMNDELRRIESKLENIRMSYAGLQSWSDSDRWECSTLKKRKKEIMETLGVKL